MNKQQSNSIAVVHLFYRDASNYKFFPSFRVEDRLLVGVNVGDEIDYTTLGITTEQFHKEIGWAYGEDDHPFVTVEKIELIN